MKLKGYTTFLVWIFSLISAPLWGQAEYGEHIQFIDSVNSLSYPHLTSSPEKAEIILLQAQAISDSIGYKEGKAGILSRLSWVKGHVGKLDESMEHRMESIRLYEELGMMLEAGYGFAELGYGVRRRSYERAEYFMRQGMKILEEFPQSVELSNAYNNYGVVKFDQEQTDSALYFVEKSLQIKEANQDSVGISYSLGYMGTIYMQSEEFDKAITYLWDSYEMKKSLEDTTGMAIDLTNLASSYNEIEDHESSINNYKASLRLALQIKYLHLAEHNYGEISRFYETNAMYDSALHYQKKSTEFREARINESTNQRLAELEIQFETEQKEKEIALQRAELSQSMLKIRNRNWILAALGSFLLLGSVIVAMAMRQQKIKQRENDLKLKLARAETENKIHQERERISRDLHDNVGAQITSLISGLEISNFYIKENNTKDALGLLSSLDFNAREAMSELRETIWLLKKEEIFFSDFIQHLRKYFKTQQPFLNGMHINLENEIPGNFKLNPGQSLHLLRIIQEGLNNCSKYAQASEFNIHFTLQNGTVKFSFWDEGSGNQTQIEDHSADLTTGNGLLNMKRRIKDLNGSLQIRNVDSKGFRIDFSFPSILENQD